MKTIQIDGRTIAYMDTGKGTPVILAHCSGASHRMWKRLVPVLADRYRVLAPDLIGYGDSERWPANQSLDPSADADVLRALVELAGGPVHLVGHSYGAATALETARLMAREVASLTLVEPVTFHLLRVAGRDAEWAEVARLAADVGAAVQADRNDEAAATFTSYWVGRLGWWLMPRRSRGRIVPGMSKVAAEFGMMERAETPLSDYEQIDIPTRLIVGERTRRPARAVVDLLVETLPNVHHRVVRRAGHMSPLTHPGEVHSLITEHIDRCEEAREARGGYG